MKRFFVTLLLVTFIALSGLFLVRFLFGGDEDTWICVSGTWVKHGNPSAPIPQTDCGVR